MNNTQEDFFASSKTLKYLRVLSIVEGSSLLALLFIAMPLKYMAGMPMAVRAVGITHGVLFLALVLLIFLVGIARDWSKGFMSFGFFMAVLPFGMLVLDKRLKKLA